MVRLIINADDFGYSQGVNNGIIHCHQKGVVNSATIMMNMPGAEHAVKLAKENPSLGVGIHLVLTCGFPLIKSHRTIVQENQSFFTKPSTFLKERIHPQEIKDEWFAQIERALFLGLKPTHLDSHHHVHTHPELQPIIKEIANYYELPVRIGQGGTIAGTTPFSSVLRTDFYGNGVAHETLNQIVNNAKTDETIEIMTHPAFVDDIVLKGSSYTYEREREVDVLTSWDVPSCVEFVTWKNLT